MRILRISVCVASLVFLSASQAGCLLVAAGAAAGTTVAYVKGDTDASVAARPDEVAVAAESAMRELSINVISRQASKLDAQVIGRTARDTKLTVTAKADGSVSRLSVRAGVFGDSALQSQLLQKIRTRIDAGRASLAATTQPAPTAATRPGDAVVDSRD